MTLKEHGSKLHSIVGQLFYCKITSVLHFWAHEKSLIWRKRRIPLSPLTLALETPMTTSHLITLWGIEEVSNCPYKFDDVLERSLRLFVTNKRWMFPQNLRWCGRRQSSSPWAPPSCTRWPGGRRRWREEGTAICNVSIYRVCVVKVPKFHGTQ